MRHRAARVRAVPGDKRSGVVHCLGHGRDIDERGRADIERDPALVERVRTMQAAFAGTDALDAAAPAPRTTFEALAMRRAREDRRRFVRRAAAAAVLAFAIGWCAWRARRGRG